MKYIAMFFILYEMGNFTFSKDKIHMKRETIFSSPLRIRFI